MTPTAVRREVRLEASPSEVWAALTEGEQISRWFGAAVELEPERGGRARFRFPDGSRREAVVETFEAQQVMILRWMPFARDAEGRTVPVPSTNITFRLQPSDGGTLLELRESLPAAPHAALGSSDPPGTRDPRPARGPMSTRAG